MDRGAWRATGHGVAKESDTTEQLNNNKTGISHLLRNCQTVNLFILKYLFISFAVLGLNLILF